MEPTFLIALGGVEIAGWIPGTIIFLALMIFAAYVKSLFDMRRARAANRRIQARQAERLRRSEEQRRNNPPASEG